MLFFFYGRALFTCTDLFMLSAYMLNGDHTRTEQILRLSDKLIQKMTINR